jgi:hypothetical protein
MQWDRQPARPVAFSSAKKIARKCNHIPRRPVPPFARNKNGKRIKEDSMTRLILSHLAILLGADDVFGSKGLWVFLSVGAVALIGIFLPITTWLESRRKEREAFYKADTLRRVSEASGDAGKSAIEFLREQNRIVQLKTIEGLKIGGLIMTAIGAGTVALLWVLAGPTVSVCGLVPLLMGLAMLAYVYFLAAPVQ